MANKLPPVLYVEWVDALVDSGWEKFDKVSDIHKCQSVGFLVRETDNSIILAAAVSEDTDGKEANATIAIPKAWIKKKRRIKL